MAKSHSWTCKSNYILTLFFTVIIFHFAVASIPTSKQFKRYPSLRHSPAFPVHQQLFLSRTARPIASNRSSMMTDPGNSNSGLQSHDEMDDIVRILDQNSTAKKDSRPQTERTKGSRKLPHRSHWLTAWWL